MPFSLPPIYPILDTAWFPGGGSGRDARLSRTVGGLAEAGVTLLQLRAKESNYEGVLHDAEIVRAAAAGMTLILNDRVNLVREAGFDGVHLGQDDMAIEQARALLGTGAILGLSTHTCEQAQYGERTSADYLAVGPVFATSSKRDTEPEVGLEGVRAAREVTRKPLVAIGGITLDRAPAVWGAGAHSVAVIGALFAKDARGGIDPAAIARDFLSRFRYNSL